MTESSVPHPIIGALVALALVGGIGYGVYHHVVSSQQSAQLEHALFEPYFDALARGQFDEAWQRYTTPRYKQLFPVERYRAHWQTTLSRAGRIERRNLAVANAAYQLSDERKYTSVQYQLTFTHDYVQAVYEIVPDGAGNPRIDWAGQHHSGSALTAPEPW